MPNNPGTIESPTLANETKIINTTNPSIQAHYGTLMYSVDDGISTNYVANHPTTPSQGHNFPKLGDQHAALFLHKGLIIGRKWGDGSPFNNVRYLLYINDEKDLCVAQIKVNGNGEPVFDFPNETVIKQFT